MFILRMNDASNSFRDRGGSSMNRNVSMRGMPGLVISMRSEKISTIGPVPVSAKS